MTPSSLRKRGFTLLEVMIASSLGVIVLATGLVVGTQMQKRALFEEQTMTAQVTGRAVKEMLTLDVSRAGTGMGNTPISFKNDDERSAITVWSKPDLTTGAGTTLGADTTNYAPPPAGFPASDALQLYWGDTAGMLTLTTCDSLSRIREEETTTAGTFCTRLNPSTALMDATNPTLAVLVSGGNKKACPVLVDSVQQGAAKLVIKDATPQVPRSDVCAGKDLWTKASGDIENWVALRLSGAAYRVNWKGGIPTLEYRAPNQTDWSVLSRDVEQLTVREGVVNLSSPLNLLEWYPGDNTAVPSAPHPAISDCNVAKHTLGSCKTDDLSSTGTALGAPTTDEETIKRLRQRVRELEVTLVIRTRRINRDASTTGTDEEGLAKDGYTRRRYTFRVAARNMAVGLTRPATAPVTP
ncbi:prepilin-type N-terminal cleavage/methylation domain-containing protein [Corallococcus exiguus]|uniref:PilW family protein n=1 Tax=Corallococcus TaxID=83461 RepID=UPI000EE2E87A|nr:MULTISPECIES: prepilin-type N-terminal cleavage/methylation domain-containing protein [Corallococcus]NNB93096.1 prepilin-type N-terminal cleavage/methylation domain-containing protein [Corallococcus exiguus]NNC02599.1 prepilin-type N-terminal cleavage/methylation domain-containing protein [Corallococcus exiguus]NPC45608.1 prepilin-type N-terminal cleavage/methylation domain-containing protein [Corallococcus exiguus]RKH87139.1 prepilin-type N-terminal cleavage/methylation domain-containing pr